MEIFLPEEIWTQILAVLSPYDDFFTAKLVCTKWNRLVNDIATHKNRIFLNAIANCSFAWHLRNIQSNTTEPELPARRRDSKSMQRLSNSKPHSRFSHSAAIVKNHMFIFGGSSPELVGSTTFNDMYKLNLSGRTWEKVYPAGLQPAPRECCVFIPYKEQIFMFGGWCQPRQVNIEPRFFDDTQVFDAKDLAWKRIDMKLGCFPSARAGHSASCVNGEMVLFGGSQRVTRLNDIWVFNMETQIWRCPHIRGKKPKGRFGHSQFTFKDQFVMILGGCGGSNDDIYADVWLLDTFLWTWTEITVNNHANEAPNLWCHSSVQIGDEILVLSEEKQCPFCHHAIQTFDIPQVKPGDDSPTCSCGRERTHLALQVSPTTLQAYLLDCKFLCNNFYCEWKTYQYNNVSIPSRRFFSAVCGINEVIVFGGLQNMSASDCTITISAAAGIVSIL